MPKAKVKQAKQKISNDSPVRGYRLIKNEINNAPDPGYSNRVLVATPSTGTVRMEWVMARYGQIIPVNWSNVTMIQYMSNYVPIGYGVDDAQNVIVKQAIEKDFEWLILYEHDTIAPPDAFVRWNEYIRNCETRKEPYAPVVSGLYFTRSQPSEPLVFRGRGTSAYTKWKMGDRVWCDGVPTGALLIHMEILRKMWEESPEYNAQGTITRRVFETPRRQWFDPETGQYNTITGTSDLDWCTRVMEGKFFEKAGWPEFQEKEYPFLIDTNIFCRHIDPDGTTYPPDSQLKAMGYKPGTSEKS